MNDLPVQRVDQQMNEVAERFAQWRASRRYKTETIPDALWAGAVSLSRQLPITRVAKALRLCTGDLRRKRDQTPALVVSVPQAAFVELPRVPLASRAGAEVEVVRADGTQLTVRLASDAAVSDVLRVFLGA